MVANMGACVRPSLEQELRDAASQPAGEEEESEDDEDVFDVPPVLNQAAAPSSEVWRLVRNSASSVTHRVLNGPPSMPPSHWYTACAWKFGLSLTATRAEDVLTPCSKCFPNGRPS